MEKAPSQWGEMPFCPEHFLRIHQSSNTFVYYNGYKRQERKLAASRNILFNKEHFIANFLDRTAKAESNRISHETSEDALSWNVFGEIYKKDKLKKVAELFTSRKFKNQPVLYLWGIRISFQEGGEEFPSLEKARSVFEEDLTTKFVTEPDVILHVPNEALILIEAKFTSKNPEAKENQQGDIAGEKPKSKSGLIKRYNPAFLKSNDFNPESVKSNFLSQIYRNLIFASYMAGELGVDWYFCNLIAEKLAKKNDHSTSQKVERFFKEIINEKFRLRATICTWENIYREIIEQDEGLCELKEYMKNKTANLEKAFDI